MTLALLFSPQGSQSIGMGRELAEAWPAAAAVFAEADGALPWSVSRVCWEGPEDLLDETRQTQPCLVTASVACHAALRSAAADAGIPLAPAVVAGHSVGEYAALVAAGVLSFPDALRLVAQRGALMAEADVPGGMAAVIGLERERVADVVAANADPAELVVANDNAPGQVVVSGTHAALARVEEALRAAGARRTIPLRVSGPFHSPAMAPVGAALAAAFDAVPWSDADPPLISNVNAAPVWRAGEIRSLLARQVSSPVEWVAGVRRAVADGVTLFLECGPGSALVGLVRRIAPDVRALPVSDRATLGTALEALGESRATVAAEASA